MKPAVFIAAVIAAAVVQSTLLEGLKVFAVKPDLLFVALFIAALSFDRSWALCIALVCGLLKDLLGTSAVALHTVLMPAACWALVQVQRRISLDNYLVGAGVLFLMLLVYDIIAQIVLGVVSFRVLFVQPLYTAAVFLLVAGRLVPWLRR